MTLGTWRPNQGLHLCRCNPTAQGTLESDDLVPGLSQDPTITNVSDVWMLESNAEVDPFLMFEQDHVVLVRTAGEDRQTIGRSGKRVGPGACGLFPT